MTVNTVRETSSDPSLYDICVGIVIFYTLVGWLVPLGIKIGYGRLKNSLIKIYLNPKLAWFLFEVPNLIWAVYFLFVSGDHLTLAYGLFILHYINRDIIYPLTMKSTNKVPIQIAFTAAMFTFANGYLQGICNRKIYQQNQNPSVLLKIIGIVLFFGGMYINIRSDSILQSTKQKSKAKPDQKGNGYAVINEFLFKYVANPNYFGEIIEWLGYFLICQKIQGFFFFFSTLNILVAAAIPRSKWNKQNLEGYPKQRKAVIPFVI